MFSKILSPSAAPAVMIGVLPSLANSMIVPPPQFDYASSLSCAKCIQAGYQFVYDSGDADASQLYMELESGNQYSGFCCKTLTDGTTDCNDTEMWEIYSVVLEQEEIEDFDSNFQVYFNTFGMEAAKGIVSELYDNKNVKVTDLEKRYYFLGLSADMTIQSRLEEPSVLKDDIDAEGVEAGGSYTSDILTTLTADIEALAAEDMLGDLGAMIYKTELVLGIDRYYDDLEAENGSPTLKANIDEVQAKVTSWTNALAVDGVIGEETYKSILQELFVILYGDEGFKAYLDADTGDFSAKENEILLILDEGIASND